jgi:hypothetical protein
MKVLLAVTVLAMVVTTQANGEILKCEGSIVNSRNDFDKRITVYINVVIPDDNAEEYVLTLADKENWKFKSLIRPSPLVKKTFIEIAQSLDKGGRHKSERYDFIVTKMPDNNNSLVGFVYGYTPWILKVDTWIENKPFKFFQTGGSDHLIQGECK